MNADEAGAAARQDARKNAHGDAREDGLSRPNAWLRELARIKPAPWSWGRAIRSALCIGVPFSVGYACDAVITGMWISMGTLMMAAAEPAGTYRFIFRHLALSGVIGALGYLAGYLTGLPWGATVLAMAAFGVLGGLLSGYGAVLSIGAMQALLLSSIAIGVPGIGPYWWLSVLYLVGAVFYMAVLGIEALLWRDRPRRQAVAGLVRALATLAAARADGLAADADAGAAPAGPGLEAARRAVTDGLRALTGLMLETQSRNVGRGRETDRLAALVQDCDALFAAILSSRDTVGLRAAGARLGVLAAAADGDAVDTASPAGPGGDRLAQAVAGVAAALAATGATPAPGRGQGGDEAEAEAAAEAEGRSHAPAAATQAGARLRIALDRLAPGAENIRAALALGLCMGLAYAAHWWDRESHWFWIPLTVSLVMKPDLGSVFARAVLRCVGTIGGAALGALALAYLPKGQPVILLIAGLSAVLPWAMRRSYVLQAVVLAPLVLLLVDIVEPGPRSADYALQRVVDTFIGGGIVLVFGYFLWPRTHHRHLAETFHGAKGLIGDYLLAACGLGSGPDLSEHRRRTYGRLADMRTRLRTALMEPPPASTEAGAWFPLVSAAERICDRVTAYSASPDRRVPPADAEAIRALARYIAATPGERVRLAPPASPAATAAGFLADGIRDELAHMNRLQDAGGFPQAPPEAPRG
ncbi:FUSC family protein [Xanthobacter sp. V4C-4]|uniref:FUSC family protein n=1 Tax=Xanthobacter cornucopiae TaxID=3119924 RepID=UPI00372CA800